MSGELRPLNRWLAVGAGLSAAFVVIVLVQTVLSRPAIRVGATADEVRAALHERRFPPYSSTCSQYGSSTNDWVVGTTFYLRPNHWFAGRRLRIVFSTNGTVANVSSSWQWRWDL